MVCGAVPQVTLPEYSPETRFEPVLTDRKHEERVERLRAITGSI